MELYIHIPFCVKKCKYCAFLSFKAESETREEYTKALIREIELRANSAANDCPDVRDENTKTKPIIDTVYIGGGTPTTLSAEELERGK